MPTLFKHAGGEQALHRLEQIFYDSVLANPVLQPLFGAGQPVPRRPHHRLHRRVVCGLDRFTREPGFGHLIDVHRGLSISEEQRVRFVELYMAALDTAGMPADQPFRDAYMSISSLDLGWRCRIPTPSPTTSFTRCVRSRAGPGLATISSTDRSGQFRTASTPLTRFGIQRWESDVVVAVRERRPN